MSLSILFNGFNQAFSRLYTHVRNLGFHAVSSCAEPVIIIASQQAFHGIQLPRAHLEKDIDVFVMRLTSMKIAYSDWQGKPNTVTLRADGVKQIYLQDPDGYWIEINNIDAAK